MQALVAAVHYHFLRADCGVCARTVTFARRLWRLRTDCGTCAQTVAFAHGLWHLRADCGVCARTVAFAHGLWRLRANCGICARTAAFARGLWRFHGDRRADDYLLPVGSFRAYSSRFAGQHYSVAVGSCSAVIFDQRQVLELCDGHLELNR
jgi:hypothetical protein